jgi:subtilisin family serine protease
VRPRHLTPLGPALAALALALPAVASAQAVSAQIVVKRTAHLSAGQNADLRADTDVSLVSTLPIPDVQVVSADDGDRDRALAALRSDPRVEWADADVLRYGTATDPVFSLQWGLSNTGQPVKNRAGTAGDDISALAAWGMSRGAGVTVGVVDSGVQLDHPDLQAQLVAGHDYVDRDEVPTDGNGHGTQVSGIVAAANNTVGGTGAAPDAKLMPLRILNDTGTGNSSNSAAALAHAGDLGLRVVNASYGSSGYSNAEETAIRTHPNTLYVVAAGNADKNVDTTPLYPCAYNDANVLCVGASDQDDAPAVFSSTSASSYGATTVDLFAPGLNIATTGKASTYVYASGTSMSAPMVTAAAAMLFSYDPQLTTQAAKQALMSSADQRDALTGLSVTGGRLDAAAALRAIGAADPVPAQTTPEEAAVVDPDATDAADTDEPDEPDVFDDATPTDAASGPLRLSAVSLDGLVRICGKKCRAKPAALRFKLSAGAPVVVSLARRKCPPAHHCTYRWAAKRTVKGRAGVQRMPVARTVAGMRLRTGRWRLTLAVAQTHRSVHFTVRRGH